MEIIGSGIDATEISRIAAAIERYGDRFVLRVFTKAKSPTVAANATSRRRSPPGSRPRKQL